MQDHSFRPEFVVTGLGGHTKEQFEQMLRGLGCEFTFQWVPPLVMRVTEANAYRVMNDIFMSANTYRTIERSLDMSRDDWDDICHRVLPVVARHVEEARPADMLILVKGS